MENSISGGGGEFDFWRHVESCPPIFLLFPGFSPEYGGQFYRCLISTCSSPQNIAATQTTLELVQHGARNRLRQKLNFPPSRKSASYARYKNVCSSIVAFCTRFLIVKVIFALPILNLLLFVSPLAANELSICGRLNSYELPVYGIILIVRCSYFSCS